MRTNLPKLLDLLIFCIYSLNFSLEFFIMIFFVTNQLNISKFLPPWIRKTLISSHSTANSKTAKFTTPRCTEPCTRSFDEIFFSDWTCLIKLSPETDCVFLIFFFLQKEETIRTYQLLWMSIFLDTLSPCAHTMNWNSFWRTILIIEIQLMNHLHIKNSNWRKIS